MVIDNEVAIIRILSHFIWYIFFLEAQMAINFEFLTGNVYWLFKKMQTSAFLRPLPPKVGKRLQLGTPSP